MAQMHKYILCFYLSFIKVVQSQVGKVSQCSPDIIRVGLVSACLSNTGFLCCVNCTMNLAGASHTQRNVWMDPLHSRAHWLFACLTPQQFSSV